MTENIVHVPYHQQLNLSKAGDVITQDHPTLDNIHLRLVRIKSINRQNGLVSITSSGDHNANGGRIGRTVEHIQLPVKNYGINTDGNPYGTFPHIGVGDRVLIGYVGKSTANPIVIGIYPDLSMLPHLTPTQQGINSTNNGNFDQYRAQKEVLPSMQVELKKGGGDYERTLNGNSFMVMLDPGDPQKTGITPPWRNDYYTGMPEDTAYGVPLDAAIDQSLGKPYPIQHERAQDWIRVHQSNTPLDQHLTKRMVRQDGSVHNFIGSKQFKSDKITEDASLHKGYTLSHKTGKLKAKTSADVKHLIKYAVSQAGKHLYGAFNIYEDKYPKKDFKNKNHFIYKGKSVPKFKWGFSNDIVYNPKHGTSDGLHFIYSCLKECHFDVPNPCWESDGEMYEGLNHKFKGTPKAGDIVFKLMRVYVGPGIKGAGNGNYHANYWSKPAILLENYHGPKTRAVAEYKYAKNVRVSDLGHLYDIGRIDDKTVESVVFARPRKTIVPSATFHLDNNHNSLDFNVVDSSIPGWAHSNSFHLGPKDSTWKCMGHSIKLSKKGILIDGKKYDPKGTQQEIEQLQNQNQQLSNKLNTITNLLKTSGALPKNLKL